jgi:hypothetical protein
MFNCFVCLLVMLKNWDSVSKSSGDVSYLSLQAPRSLHRQTTTKAYQSRGTVVTTAHPSCSLRRHGTMSQRTKSAVAYQPQGKSRSNSTSCMSVFFARGPSTIAKRSHLRRGPLRQAPLDRIGTCENEKRLISLMDPCFFPF